MHVIRTGPISVNSLVVPLVRNLVFVVDPACCQYTNDSDVILDFLKQNKLEPVAIILTHGHFDHVSGLSLLNKAFPEIPIAIHKADSNLIGADSEAFQKKHLEPMGFDEFLPYVSNLPAPTHFLEDGKSLAETFADVITEEDLRTAFSKWKTLHTPGHTEGSCCLYNEEDLALISGDTLFYRSWGRTDLPGGSESKIRKSLLRLADEIEESAAVYPGHEKYGFKMEENF